MRPNSNAPAAWIAAASAALWLLSGGSATAVDIKGNLRAGPGSPKTVEPLRPAYWREWNGFIEPVETKLDLHRAVTVVLVGGKSSTDSVAVEFEGGDLSPRTIVVQKGAALRLRNTDDAPHELYAKGLESFGPDETRPGLGRQVVLEQSGSWPLRDKLAPYVQGYLHVLDNVAAVAQPDKDGGFSFSDVPAGKYTLKVFYGPDEVASKPIEVPSSGKTISVDPMLINPRTR